MDDSAFIADWQAGLITDVVGAGNKLFGKQHRGQAGNPLGFIIVSCDVPT